MAFTNAGPSSEVTINTVPVRSTAATYQTIAVAMTPVALAASTATEQSFGLNGASFATAATGILAGDVIVAVNAPSTTAGVVIGGARVDTAVNDKFYVTFGNCTAGTPTPPGGTYLITIARYIQSVSTTPGTLSTLPSSVTSN